MQSDVLSFVCVGDALSYGHPVRLVHVTRQTSLVRWCDTALSTTLQGWTPLHHAAFHGNLEKISSLITNGADIAAECLQAGTHSAPM